MSKLILEITRPDGHREHHAVTAFPLRLGRGFRNDVVLSDDYVSAQHLAIDRDDDGTLWADDLASENGTYLAPDKKKRQRLDGRTQLAPGLPLLLGKTTITLWPEEAAVAPALLLDPAHHTTGLLRHLLVAALPLLLLLLYSVVISYLGTMNNEDFSGMVGAPAGAALLIVVWAGNWAFLSRLFMHRASFLRHVAIGSSVVLLLLLGDVLLDMLVYSLEGASGVGRVVARQQGILEIALGMVCLSLLTSLHLKYTFPLSVRRRRQIAVGLPLAILIVGLAVQQFDDEPQGHDAQAGIMLPLALRAAPLRTPAQMLDGLVTLEKEVAVDVVGKAKDKTQKP